MRNKSKPAVELGDVLQSSPDNEADHPDQPTLEDEVADETADFNKNNQEYVVKSPQIDLFINKLGKAEDGVISSGRKGQKKKLAKQQQPQRSHSARHGKNKGQALGKTFARMQIIKHINREGGDGMNTIEKTVKMKEHLGSRD